MRGGAGGKCDGVYAEATFGVVWCVFVEVWGVLGVFRGTDCFNTKSK